MLHFPRPSRVSGYVAARFGPPVIDPGVVHEALSRFNLEPGGPPRNLPLGRRSHNVAIMTGAGPKVVKQYRSQWVPSMVQYGHSILGRLEERCFPAPRLVRAGDAQTWTAIDGRLIAVFDFIPGTNHSLDFLLPSDRLRLTASMGRSLARFHHCLEGFVPEGQHPLGLMSPTGAHRRGPAWHAAKLDELRGSGAEAAPPEAAVSRLLAARADQVLEEITRLSEALDSADLPRAVIHGDYGLHNLLFTSGGSPVPVDFELSRLDWRVNDLVAALFKIRSRRGAYPVGAMAAFMGAYAGELSLNADEEHMLPDAWRLFRLKAAVQGWAVSVENGDDQHKLVAALDSIEQANWLARHPEVAVPHADTARLPIYRPSP
jgi:Ser/Thr protein kinase RdoA (MazF antagonist)